MNTRTKVISIVLALVTMLGVTACATGPSQEQVTCAGRGGTWELQYMMPVITYVTTGNVRVPVTNHIPIYGCEEPR